jgi:murein DD-endopeptidase MepM/ murein hydrolase activator NlpD
MTRFARRNHLLLALAAALAGLSVAGAAVTGAADSRLAPEKSAAAKVSAADRQALAGRHLAMPVQGVAARSLVDNFDEGRGGHKHEAIDILAPRGTPVVAVDDGRVARLFRSAAGGITVYQFDRDEKFVYYYAHLDRYASGLKEGAMLKRGEALGEVGTTGNAPRNTPHLHFTIFRMGPEKRWWKGTAINPYPFLTAGPAPIPGA